MHNMLLSVYQVKLNNASSRFNKFYLITEINMKTMKIAIPSNKPGGMDAVRSDHFGHADLFTVVMVEENKVVDVDALEQVEHEAGGCMLPVRMLKENKVDALVVGGLGRGPMKGLSEAGVKVYFANIAQCADVQSAVDMLQADQLPLMHMDQVCTGSGNCHH